MRRFLPPVSKIIFLIIKLIKKNYYPIYSYNNKQKIEFSKITNHDYELMNFNNKKLTEH